MSAPKLTRIDVLSRLARKLAPEDFKAFIVDAVNYDVEIITPDEAELLIDVFNLGEV